MPVHYPIEGATASAISDSVERGVRTGRLPPGTALPPVRTLATDLGVSPGTVAKAYQALRLRGVVETAGRNGTRIRARPSVQARTERHLGAPPGVLDLSSGWPDPRLLPDPRPQLRALADSAPDDPVAAPVAALTRNRDAGALPELIELARARLAVDSVPVETAALAVTGGALDGIDRLLGAHLRPGDLVAVEDPGWANLLDLLAALGLEPIGMPVDDDGPTEDGLRTALRAGARAVVITTRSHNPTGATVGVTRAAALREVLRVFPTVLVIEDDHAAELSSAPLHPLAGAVPHWAFLRSVSKPYGPDLRLAVLAGDEATVARVVGRMRLGTGWVSSLMQRLVVGLWRDDTVAALVATARDAYTIRRTALMTALAARGLAARGRTGINVWVPVPDETRAVAVLRDRGYAVAPGSLFRITSAPGIRITISPLETSDIEPLADAVAAAVAPTPVVPFTS